MDSRRVIFDSSSSSPSSTCHGNMFFLGGGNQVTFRGGGGRSVLNMEEGCLGAGGAAGKRRPFFSTHEQLMMMDDDYYYYDEQMLPEKKRRLTPDQVQMLESSFEEENKLEPDRKSELAKKLGLQPRQVAVWFQNRRARWKTKQLERDFDRLKSSYDSLLADHDSVLKDNISLRSQILALTEKLQAKDLPVAGRTTEGGTAVAGGLVGLQGEMAMAAAPAAAACNNDNNLLSASLFGTLKAEDHLSTGSGGSAVVDQESPQLVDSGNSHLTDDVGSYHGGFGGGGLDGGGVQSEEDDGSDVDGRGFFPGVFVDDTGMVGHHQPEQEEAAWNALSWWMMWS